MLEGHEAIITAMMGHFSSNSNLLFSGGYDGKVISWSLSSYEKLGEVKLHGYINSLAIDVKSGGVFAGGEDRFLCGVKLVNIL